MKVKISPSKLILLSFGTIILFGAFLLMLPVSYTDRPVGFIEALFTATSATCVTGLTVFDIGTRLTIFGQLVVLFLIQTGGLGIMTFSTFFIYFLSRRLSIRNREILLQSLSQHPVKDMGQLLLTVFQVTFVIEIIGAFFLWTRFVQDFPPGRAAYLAFFHAISAFCNAGFSLFATSFMDYKSDLTVNITVMLLLVAGGLGFIVFFDLYRYWRSKLEGTHRGLHFHSRIVLITTGCLIIGGAIIILGFEWFNVMRPFDWKTRILTALFQSMTSRTCGFNTLNIGQLTDATLIFILFLMFVGASPASTGGGVKTSTLAIILAMVVARFKDQEDVNLLNRRISQDIVSRAVAVTFFSGFLITVCTLLLLLFETGGLPHAQAGGRFMEYIFEATSAFGTVGLSTGITAGIKDPGRLILISLMYIGRVGPLALAIELAGGDKKKLPYRLPEEENILIG